jgi:Leucine-rich repeat (LRR) protein
MIRPLPSGRVRARPASIVAFLLAVSTSDPATSAGTVPSSERQALLDLYLATSGATWALRDGWSSDAVALADDPCSWYGVDCNPDHTHITGLRLRRNRLSGRLPNTLGRLPHLANLDLSGNRLRGAIPATVADLRNLKELSLASNQLSGAIPTRLLSISGLEQLDLSDNDLEGSIPGVIAAGSRLASLNLSSNRLTGSIPHRLSQMSALIWLNAARNHLSGPLPPTIGNTLSLEGVDLSHNKLEGPLPESIARLSRLSRLDLSDNRLTGSFQPLVLLKALTVLNLRKNQFSAYVPSGLFRLPTLTQLDLSGNDLQGSIPRAIAQSDSLALVNLSSGSLVGRIPPTIANLSALRELDLSNNRLSGAIPTELMSMSSLAILRLDRNQLSGPIPALSGLSSAQVITLSTNRLSGTVAVSEPLDAIRILDLSHNLLTGPVPIVGPSLERLYLNHNHLTGTLEIDESQFRRAIEIDLRANALSGPIPASLFTLPRLQILRLAFNRFSTLPQASLASSPSLSWLDVRGNELTDDDQPAVLPPRLIALDFRDNRAFGNPRGPQRLLPFAPPPTFKLLSPVIMDSVERLNSTPAKPPSHAISPSTPAPPSALPSPTDEPRAAIALGVQGHVFDDIGAAIAGATVRANQAPAGQNYETHSGADGAFRLSVGPGTYTVSASLPGFSTTNSEPVVVSPASSQTVDLRLHVASVTETVSVSTDDQRPVGPIWNLWVRGLGSASAQPVRVLRKGLRYRLNVDLAPFAYGRDVASIAVDPALRNAAARAYKDGDETTRLWVLPQIIGRAVWLGNDIAKRRLISTTWKAGDWLPNDNPRRLAVTVDLRRLFPDTEDGEHQMDSISSYSSLGDKFRAAGLTLDLFAADEGCATVSLAVWDAQLARAIDNLTYHIQVGSSVTCAEQQSSRVARGLAQYLTTPEYAHADAALQIAEFEDGPLHHTAAFLVPGLASDAAATECGSFFGWEPPANPTEFVFSNAAFAFELQSAWGSSDLGAYDKVARWMRETLFDASAPCGGDAAMAYLRRLAAEPNRVLSVQVTRDEEPIFFPLGLLFLLADDSAPDPHTRVFSNAIDISQPLAVQSEQASGCIRDWTFAIPDRLVLLGVVEDVTMPDELRNSPERVPDIKGLRDHLSSVGSDSPSGLVILGHHFDQTLYFSDAHDSLLFAEIQKPLGAGSAVMLSACAAGDPRHDRYIARAFEEGGADAFVISPFDVPARFGIALAIEFSRLVIEVRSGDRDVPVRDVYERAVSNVAAEAAKAGVLSTDGLAAQFVLAGNGGLTICGRAPNQ